jgi:membrane associated rhomboid family serine protease
MIPIKDDQPSRSFPYINLLLIAANVLVFLFEISLSSRAAQTLIMDYGLIPARFSTNFSTSWYTLFTSMFLHGGWLHIIFNMLALFIFGDNIEDRLGHFRYLLFYMLGGFIAGGAHILANQGSTVPTIGASGAIAAVLGAYLLLFPRARVVTIIPLFFFFPVIRIPAVLYLGFWFISQLFNGYAQIATNTLQGGVAWWAHIGGFVFGMLVVIFFGGRRKRRKSVWEAPEVIERSLKDD